MVVYNNILAGAAGSGGAADYTIERSLRLNSSDQSKLTKTPSTQSNTKTWTLSWWMKAPEVDSTIFAAGNGNTPGRFSFGTNGNGAFFAAVVDNNSSVFSITTDAFFRDPSAWYHCCLVCDSTATTQADRFKIIVNGVRQTVTGTLMPAGQNTFVNTTQNHQWSGRSYLNIDFADGYLADIQFVDGQAIDPDGNFGEFDADTGVWNPIKYTGSYNAAASGTMYSADLTTNTGNFNTGGAAYLAFDGDQSGSTRARAENSYNNYVEFAPSTPISFTNGVYVKCYAANGFTITNYWSVDLDGNGLGSETTFTGGSSGFNDVAWVQVATGSGTLHKVRIRITRTSDPVNAGITAIGINGTADSNLLVDGTPAGVNGFHLDFSDTSSASAIGTDSSGNGNNWTANNLSNVVGNGNWISQVVTTGGNRDYSSSYGVPQMFDNSTSTEMLNGGGTSSTWTPVGGLAFSSSFKMAAYDGDGGSITFNWSGGSYTWTLPTSNNTYPLTELSSYLTSPLTSITWSTPNIQGPYVYEVQVDGVRLVDNQYTDTDVLRDSPTNGSTDDDTGAGGEVSGNYATWNSLTNRGVVTTSNGNLTANATSSNYGYTLSTIPVSSGKYYCEISFEGTMAHSVNYNYIGIVPTDSAAIYTGQDIFRADGALSIDSNGSVIRGNIGTGSNDTNNTYQSSYGFDENDTIGIAIDCDTPQVTFYKNGTSIGTFPHTMQSNKSWVLFVNDWANGADLTGYILNAGQRPFSYTPPTGFKSLCTTNLSDPLIANSSDHFETKIWSGDGTSSRSFTDYEFSPDMIWGKSRSHTNAHWIMDTVRGPGKRLEPQATDAEDTPSGIVTSFDSNGFTMGSNTENNGSGRTYVAWAWDGGDLATNSAYNQSQAWSTLDTWPSASYSTVPGNVFNGTYGTQNTSDFWYSSGASTVNLSNLAAALGTGVTNIKIWIFDRQGDVTVTVNSATATESSDNAYQEISINHDGSAITTFTIQGTDSSYWGIAGIKINDTLLVDAGLIPAGSLTSTLYNQDQVWSNFLSSSNGFVGGYEALYAFNEVLNSGGGSATNGTGGVMTFAPTSALSVSTMDIRVYSDTTITFPDNSTVAVSGQQSSLGWISVTLPSSFTGFTGSNSITLHNTNGGLQYFDGLRINGKVLVNSNVSLSVPSIASTVRANPTAGFSILTFSMPSVSTATIAHGLNAAPAFYVWKDRDSADSWYTYHSALGAGKYVTLNGTGTSISNSSIWNNTDPDSSVIHTGSTFSNTGSTLVYAFSPVEGYSAFGKYKGNASANGPVVYTGFRPAFILTKGIDDAEDWYIRDTARSPFNEVDESLRPNDSGSEYSGRKIDILSNGFKIRDADSQINENGKSYLYAAFAENPFKYARAR